MHWERGINECPIINSCRFSRIYILNLTPLHLLWSIPEPKEIHITYLNEIIKDYIENYGYNKFIEDLKSYLRTKNKELKNLNIKLDNTLKLLKQEIKIETGRSKLKQKKIEREKLIERRTNNIKTIELYKELIKKIKLYTELIK